MSNVETKNRVLTDEEIIEEYKLGDNNGMLEFARSIERMTIKNYQAKVAALAGN